MRKMEYLQSLPLSIQQDILDCTDVYDSLYTVEIVPGNSIILRNTAMLKHIPPFLKKPPTELSFEYSVELLKDGYVRLGKNAFFRGLHAICSAMPKNTAHVLHIGSVDNTALINCVKGLLNNNETCGVCKKSIEIVHDAEIGFYKTSIRNRVYCKDIKSNVFHITCLDKFSLCAKCDNRVCIDCCPPCHDDKPLCYTHACRRVCYHCNVLICSRKLTQIGSQSREVYCEKCVITYTGCNHKMPINTDINTCTRCKKTWCDQSLWDHRLHKVGDEEVEFLCNTCYKLQEVLCIICKTLNSRVNMYACFKCERKNICESCLHLTLLTGSELHLPEYADEYACTDCTELREIKVYMLRE